MNSPSFTNARVHDWLSEHLDDVVQHMRTSRVQLNSAAIWWFCTRLSIEERAEILGEYVKHQAMTEPPMPGVPETPPPTKKRRKSKSS